MTDTVDLAELESLPGLPLCGSTGLGDAGAPVWSLEAMADVLAGLTGTSWVSAPPDVQLEMVRAIERLRSVLDGVELAVVEAVEARTPRGRTGGRRRRIS